MDQQKWLLVKANFDGTEDLADGYYRLREVDGGYQLAYLVAGPCGDKIRIPRLHCGKKEIRFDRFDCEIQRRPQF